MPDSLRDLLHRRAAEGFDNTDLAAGALQRARDIGRRRTAAVAIGAVVGIAAASVAAASLIEPSPPQYTTPPAGSTTGPAEEPVAEPPEDPNPDTRPGREPDGGICGLPDLPEWEGWGESDSATTLDELPITLYFRDKRENMVTLAVTGSITEVVLEDESVPNLLAPDGFRYMRAAMCTSEILTLGHLGDGIGPIDLGGHFCMPAWSPDSNRIAAWSESPEDYHSFILDVSTGTVTELGGEVPCESVWSGDGEHLTWIGGDSLMMTVDQDGRAGMHATLSDWFTEGSPIVGLSAVSAGLTHACLEIGDPEYGSSGHWKPAYCDLYIDLATQEELELPVSGDRNQVVFLTDGSMIVVTAEEGALTVSLVDPEGQVVDERAIPESISAGAKLVAYPTG